MIDMVDELYIDKIYPFSFGELHEYDNMEVIVNGGRVRDPDDKINELPPCAIWKTEEPLPTMMNHIYDSGEFQYYAERISSRFSDARYNSQSMLENVSYPNDESLSDYYYPIYPFSFR